MEKTFTVVPRGIGLVIGCSTFPTWNSYPGLFASLATGNAVVVKPHPAAVCRWRSPSRSPVTCCRDGLLANLVTLVAENPGGTVASELAVRSEVRIVDFTGSTAFGQWLEEHARQAAVYTEKAGVNMVLVESTDDYAGMLANLAFSLCLYSGRCARPRRTCSSPPPGSGRPRAASRWTSSPPTSAPRWRAARPGRAGRRAARRDRQRRRSVACRRAGEARRRSSPVPDADPSRVSAARVRTPALVRVPAERVEPGARSASGRSHSWSSPTPPGALS